MRLAPLGFTLDAAFLLGSTYLLFTHSTLMHDIKADGLAALIRLPLPSLRFNTTNSSIPSVDVAPPVANDWFQYVFGTELGWYASQRGVIFQEQSAWINTLILPSAVVFNVPHLVAVWLRNLIAAITLYLVLGAVWSIAIYRSNEWPRWLPRAAERPSLADIMQQAQVALSSMPLFTVMPTLGEWLMERGFTRAIYDVQLDLGASSAAAGWVTACAWFAVYLAFVEWGIYWVHRYLHDNKTLYKLLHKKHHIYNNPGTMTPFAGLAFNPIDGMLQSAPYIVGLLVAPVHSWVHIAALFFTGIWTNNVHDTLTGDTEPVMGSAYHTLHHTLYWGNYGQFFVFFDWVHDTLEPPAHRKAQWGWPANSRGGVEKKEA